MDTSKHASVTDRERYVLEWQRGVVFATMLLFIPLLYLSHLMFRSLRYGLLMVCAAGFYIAVSSIRNRVTLFTRWRGVFGLEQRLSVGSRAVMVGVLLIVFDIAWLIFIFTPSLSDKYLNW